MPKKGKSKSKSKQKIKKDIPPSPILPPVFNGPPDPPNPSLAQSENQEEELEEIIPEIHGECSNLPSDSEHGSSDDDCCHKGVDSAEKPPPVENSGIFDYFGKFNATANETCNSTRSQMIESIKDAMDMEGRFVPIDGLTSAETKRQAFHGYLKSSGLLGVIGEIILGLYELDEYPPKDKLPEFISDLLDYTDPKIEDDIAEASAYNKMLDIRLQRLQVENDWLHRRLDDFECSETPIEYLDPDFFDPKLNEERKIPEPLPIIPRELKNLKKPSSKEFLELKEIFQSAIDDFDAMDMTNIRFADQIAKNLAKEAGGGDAGDTTPGTPKKKAKKTKSKSKGKGKKKKK